MSNTGKVAAKRVLKSLRCCLKKSKSCAEEFQPLSESFYDDCDDFPTLPRSHPEKQQPQNRPPQHLIRSSLPPKPKTIKQSPNAAPLPVLPPKPAKGNGVYVATKIKDEPPREQCSTCPKRIVERPVLPPKPPKDSPVYLPSPRTL